MARIQMTSTGDGHGVERNEEEPADLIIENNGRHGFIRMEFGQLRLEDQRHL